MLSLRNMTEKNVLKDFSKPNYILQLILSGLIICLHCILKHSNSWNWLLTQNNLSLSF